MEREVVGWSDATLSLDDSFAYAGKFRVPNGKAVTREDGETVGALSFSPDHADDEAVRVRYITVREDRRGEGIGSALLRFAAERLLERYAAVRISVNNPFAYEASHKAGFGWTGETSGLASLVLERPPPDSADATYAEGMRRFLGRDISDDEESFVRRKIEE